jgi:hypothetical protein
VPKSDFYFHIRHKEIADKRSDEELINMMQKWSSAKERIENEISRKIQSAYEASQFEKCEYKPKEINLKDYTDILDKNRATKMLESDLVNKESKGKKIIIFLFLASILIR